jgi:hypothetical protein
MILLHGPGGEMGGANNGHNDELPQLQFYSYSNFSQIYPVGK